MAQFEEVSQQKGADVILCSHVSCLAIQILSADYCYTGFVDSPSVTNRLYDSQEKRLHKWLSVKKRNTFIEQNTAAD